MATRRLHNYLRMYRKRAGLSQDDVAFLVGVAGGDKVSRYERGNRLPSLETLFAYEAALGVPARELFAGYYEKVEQETKRRARTLARRLAAGNGQKPSAHPRQVVATDPAFAAPYHES